LKKEELILDQHLEDMTKHMKDSTE